MAKRVKVTSAQVAQKAGVSRTTVSLVLNMVETANISDATRQRVLEVASELGYVPDASAQALVQGYSRNIALAIFQPSHQAFLDPYVAQILTGITRTAQTQGFRLTLELVEHRDHIAQLLKLVRGGTVDGIITEHWMDTQQLIDEGFTPDDPLVLLAESQVTDFHTVHANLLNGQRALIDHLLHKGHRVIGCIPYTHPQNSLSLKQRLTDYLNQTAQHGLLNVDAWLTFGDYSIDTGYQAMQQLLRRSPRPTAIYAMNDSMAFGAMRAIYDAGLRIPDDIAVVGHDDHRNAAWSIPALTTVRVPWLELGSIAAAMLIQQITGEPIQNTSIHLDSELVIRESCGGE